MRLRVPVLQALLWGLLGLGVLLLPGAASADQLGDAVAKADKRAVSQLKSVTKWAAGKRISGFRHRVFRLVLRIAPDDERARSVLGYKRKGKDGPWTKDAGYAEPADFAKGLLPKGQERVAKVLTHYREAVLHAMDDDGGAGTPRHQALMARLIDLMPDDAVLHERLGDVQQDGHWIMPETLAARKERKRLAGIVAECRRSAREGIKPIEKEAAKSLPMGWISEKRFIMGIVPKEDGKQCLLAMESADLLCNRIVGPSKQTRWPTQAIVFDTRESARLFLESKPEWKKALAALDLVSSTSLPDGTYITWGRAGPTLSSAGARQVIDAALDLEFRGHERGWITEGVGQRITWYLLGRHGPAFVNIRSTEVHRTPGEGEALPTDPSAWNKAAAAVLRRDGPKRLAAVLTKRLNAMRAADVLVAYGLAAFLMETRPKDFIRFARRSAKRHDVDAIVKEALGADDVAVLSRVLARWLVEN